MAAKTLTASERIYYEGYLVELRKVYFSGASRVKYMERDTTFRSQAEMKAIIDELDELLNPPDITVRSGAGYAEFGTGL